MTYLQLERIGGSSVAAMTAAGYTPVAANTIRFDEQERTGKGWQAHRVTGLGLSPVSITATPSQVGSNPRFVRKLERNIDIGITALADDKAGRDALEAKLNSVLSGECVLRMRESSGTYKYLRVYFAGGGTYSLGEDSISDTELALVVTLRAHKPDWLIGG